MCIIHIHGNNFDPMDKFNNPAHLEITFANKKIINIPRKKSKETYPIRGLDYPCNPMKEDVQIIFKK